MYGTRTARSILSAQSGHTTMHLQMQLASTNPRCRENQFHGRSAPTRRASLHRHIWRRPRTMGVVAIRSLAAPIALSTDGHHARARNTYACCYHTAAAIRRPHRNSECGDWSACSGPLSPLAMATPSPTTASSPPHSDGVDAGTGRPPLPQLLRCEASDESDVRSLVPWFAVGLRVDESFQILDA